MSHKDMKKHEFLFCENDFLFILWCNTVSLLLDNTLFCVCLHSFFFLINDDDEDVARRDGAHLSNLNVKKKKNTKDIGPANELRFSL